MLPEVMYDTSNRTFLCDSAITVVINTINQLKNNPYYKTKSAENAKKIEARIRYILDECSLLPFAVMVSHLKQSHVYTIKIVLTDIFDDDSRFYVDLYI